jgi:hypothetical protein
MRKEFWKVQYSGSGLDHVILPFYVLANSAAEAEKKGMPLAERKTKDYVDPGEIYCISAEVVGEIEA